MEGATGRDLDIERRLGRLEKQADDVEVWRRNVIELAAQQRASVAANTNAIETLGRALDRMQGNVNRVVWLLFGTILAVGADVVTQIIIHGGKP